MEKTARKPSADPVQERLRQNKANLNKDTSSFINDLIHFKKMINGWPSKYWKERGRIIDPIPADPTAIISSLISEFQDIANRANGIVQEQLNYSKTRQQKRTQQATKTLNTLEQKHGPETAPSTIPAPDLAQQLGKGASDNHYLISEASNPLTRFFSRLLQPGIGVSGEGARIRKYRLSLLNAALQLYKDLRKIQSTIVSSGPQSIFVASKLLDKAENNYVFLVSGIRAFQQTLPQGAVDIGGKIDVPPEQKEVSKTSPTSIDPRITQALTAVKDIQASGNNFRDAVGMSALIDLAMRFYLASPEKKLGLADGLLDAYRQMIVRLSTQKHIPIQKSFADILAMDTKTSTAGYQLQIVAQNILGKWKHQLSPFDKTSAFRLDVYNLAGEVRKLTDKVMDSLESDLDTNVLSQLIAQIGDNLVKLRNLMQGLTSTIRGIGYQPQFLNMLERGRLGDYDVSLTPKQKTDLEKMLEQRQMRELTKMYTKR